MTRRLLPTLLIALSLGCSSSEKQPEKAKPRGFTVAHAQAVASEFSQAIGQKLSSWTPQQVDPDSGQPVAAIGTIRRKTKAKLGPSAADMVRDSVRNELVQAGHLAVVATAELADLAAEAEASGSNPLQATLLVEGTLLDGPDGEVVLTLRLLDLLDGKKPLVEVSGP